MKGRLSFLVLGLGVLLMNCSLPVAGVASRETASPIESSPIAPVEIARGQQLPVSARAQIANTVIYLEVASTPRQQALGLMYRPALPSDRGMLFPFDPPRVVQFWMKNVPVPLDMVFIRDGVVQAIATSAAPCQQDPCPTYGPNVPVNQVIELRAGRAAELGIRVGDRIPIQFLSPSQKP